MDINSENLWNIKQAALDNNVSVRILLSGTSMLPFIKSGDVALIHKVSSDDIRPGDIIAIKKQDQYIAHRLIKIAKHNSITLLTKGDSCKEYDSPITFSDVIGKVILMERKNKTIEITSIKMKLIGYFYSRFPRLSYYNYLLYYYIKKLFVQS